MGKGSSGTGAVESSSDVDYVTSEVALVLATSMAATLTSNTSTIQLHDIYLVRNVDFFLLYGGEEWLSIQLFEVAYLKSD